MKKLFENLTIFPLEKIKIGGNIIPILGLSNFEAITLSKNGEISLFDMENVVENKEGIFYCPEDSFFGYYGYLLGKIDIDFQFKPKIVYVKDINEDIDLLEMLLD